MKATLRKLTGTGSAIESMFMSKRTWTSELGRDIFQTSEFFESSFTRIDTMPQDVKDKYYNWMKKVAKIGKKHTTLLRFIDMTIMTEGMHRAGQDDIDAHAKRFESRIIRSSTRLAEFGEEMSDFYKGKIMSATVMFDKLCMDIPETVFVIATNDKPDERMWLSAEQYSKDATELTLNGYQVVDMWVRTANGYIRKEYENDQDVKRGLYMLSIPSNFISKINITEWAHVYRERNKNGHANPEVKEWAEQVQDQLEKAFPFFNREYIMEVRQ